jgi:hypothetical protein
MTKTMRILTEADDAAMRDLVSTRTQYIDTQTVDVDKVMGSFAKHMARGDVFSGLFQDGVLDCILSLHALPVPVPRLYDQTLFDDAVACPQMWSRARPDREKTDTDEDVNLGMLMRFVAEMWERLGCCCVVGVISATSKPLMENPLCRPVSDRYLREIVATLGAGIEPTGPYAECLAANFPGASTAIDPLNYRVFTLKPEFRT